MSLAEEGHRAWRNQDVETIHRLFKRSGLAELSIRLSKIRKQYALHVFGIEDAVRLHQVLRIVNSEYKEGWERSRYLALEIFGVPAGVVIGAITEDRSGKSVVAP